MPWPLKISNICKKNMNKAQRHKYFTDAIPLKYYDDLQCSHPKHNGRSQAWFNVLQSKSLCCERKSGCLESDQSSLSKQRPIVALTLHLKPAQSLLIWLAGKHWVNYWSQAKSIHVWVLIFLYRHCFCPFFIPELHPLNKKWSQMCLINLCLNIYKYGY